MTIQRYGKKKAEENREFFVTPVNFRGLCLHLYCSGLCNMEERWLKGWPMISKSWIVQETSHRKQLFATSLKQKSTVPSDLDSSLKSIFMQYIMKLWESLPQVLSSPRHKKFRNILNHTLGDFHWLLNLDTKRQLTELLNLSLQEVRRLHQGRIVLYFPTS